MFQGVKQVRPFVGCLAENTLVPDYSHWMGAIAGLGVLVCPLSHSWPGHQRRGFTDLFRGRLRALHTTSSPHLLRTSMFYIQAAYIYVYVFPFPRVGFFPPKRPLRLGECQLFSVH